MMAGQIVHGRQGRFFFTTLKPRVEWYISL